jgi:hypothetical protein
LSLQLSLVSGFKVSWFDPNRDRDRYRDRLFNHGTHRTHGKAWLCFRVFSVFRGSNQKLRSAPNRCGADLNGSQCLRGFAQNLHAQLLFLGLKVHPALRANTPHRRCTPCPNLACAHTLNLKRAVEPSTLFGFWFQGFMV